MGEGSRIFLPEIFLPLLGKRCGGLGCGEEMGRKMTGRRILRTKARRELGARRRREEIVRSVPRRLDLV
jgi:hypothetical protein